MPHERPCSYTTGRTTLLLPTGHRSNDHVPLVYQESIPWCTTRFLPPANFLSSKDLSSRITFRHVTGREKIILKISFQYRRTATNKRPQRWTLSKVFKEFDASVSLMRTCGIYLYSLSLFLQNILSIKNGV